MSSMLKPPKAATPRKDRGEVAEEAVATAYVRTRNLVEEYRMTLIAVGIGIAVIFLGVLGYFYWQHGQARQAEEALGAILPTYEAGEYAAALDGTPEADGLLTVADRYRRSTAGNLAAFYAANALLNLERYDDADRYFARYRGEDILQASALAGRAAVAEQQGDPARAARLFEQAARTFRSPAVAPEYLLDAARNHEAAGDLAAARRNYETVASDYAESPLATVVPIHTARLDALAQAE
jgi:TolA-binding protein